MGATNKTGQPQTIESLSRGLDILGLFSVSNTELSVVEISRQLGVSQSTAYRLLQTLQYKGFVNQNPDTRRYRLSLRVIEVASIVLDSMDLRHQALQEMEELAGITDARANLAVRDGEDLIFVARVESPRVSNLFFHLGKRAPLHATGLGKVLLAHQPEGELEELLSRLPLQPVTSRTITDREQLRTELREIRKRGYAIDRGEYMDDINALAAPVHDRTQRIAAAISVSGPTSFLTPQRLEELREPVLRASRAISNRLGYWH